MMSYCRYCDAGRGSDWTKERLALLRMQMSNMIYAAQAIILLTTLIALMIYPFASVALSLFFGFFNIFLSLPQNTTLNMSTYNAFSNFAEVVAKGIPATFQWFNLLVLALILILIVMGKIYWNKNKQAVALVEHLSHLEKPNSRSSPQSPSPPL